MNATRQSTARGFRLLGWVAVASMLAVALLGPSAAPAIGAGFNGAIWTSLADGATVNANQYDAKTDVYLNGGPQNCGNSNGLPDGDYYFQVTNPSGSELLSSDEIKYRQIEVVDGVIAGVSGDGNHLEGSNGCNGGTPVQLFPYDDTPNAGGEYSVDMAPKADVDACLADYEGELIDFNFLQDCGAIPSKNDNFKVGEEPPVLTPAIHIEKAADPTSLPAGGGEVHYTYAVTNAGDAVLSNISVDDDKCAPVTFVDGDSNGDDLLDLHETWNFECTTTITEDTTNTAVAHGWLGETEVTDDDTAVVTVAASGPAIHIEKLATPTALPVGGGDVDYTYTVTNAGNVPLSDVTVVDDKCAPVVFIDGDTSGDDLLDLDETWTYGCSATLTQSTTNVAVATGHDGDTEVTDDDTATVAVAAPSQSILAITDPPLITNPPSDLAGDGPARPSADTWRLLLVLLAGALASLLVMTPARAPRRR